MTAQSCRAGVLVDVDGTLVDSNYLHTLAWARAFRDLGVWAPMNAIHRLVGMGGDHLVRELFGRDIAGADAAHAARYAELESEAEPFPKAAALLRRMHDAGLVVVIATSASEDDVAKVRAKLCADDAIDAIVHGGDVTTTKPDPDIFDAARKKGGIDSAAVLAIGDSVWDIEAARSAGMGCVAVESGGFSRSELAAAGALVVYRDVQELEAQLFTSPIAALLQRVESR